MLGRPRWLAYTAAIDRRRPALPADDVPQPHPRRTVAKTGTWMHADLLGLLSSRRANGRVRVNAIRYVAVWVSTAVAAISVPLAVAVVAAPPAHTAPGDDSGLSAIFAESCRLVQIAYNSGKPIADIDYNHAAAALASQWGISNSDGVMYIRHAVQSIYLQSNRMCFGGGW